MRKSPIYEGNSFYNVHSIHGFKGLLLHGWSTAAGALCSNAIGDPAKRGPVA